MRAHRISSSCLQRRIRACGGADVNFVQDMTGIIGQRAAFHQPARALPFLHVQQKMLALPGRDHLLIGVVL
ncbi:MAG: hypothetical protein CVT73_12320, partial [Alphaproteobacteria bacterium HGW-Alphaproteobacteria-12]